MGLCWKLSGCLGHSWPLFWRFSFLCACCSSTCIKRHNYKLEHVAPWRLLDRFTTLPCFKTSVCSADLSVRTCERKASGSLTSNATNNEGEERKSIGKARAWNTAVCTCHVYNPDLPFVIFFLCIPSFLADKTSNKGPPSFKSRTKMTKGWYLLRILYLASTLLLQEHSKTCFSKNMAQQSDSTLRWSKCTEYSRVLHGLQISTALSCNMFLHVPTTCSHSMFLPDPSSSSSPWTSALYGVCSHHRAPQQVYEVQNCNFSSLFKFFKFFKSFQGELAIAIPAFSPRALCKALL